MNNDQVTPIPSSTLIVIRDSNQGIEVLMTERNPRMNFAEGALVFPGGKIDEGDGEENYNILSHDVEKFKSEKIAALRELFEETGLLHAFTDKSKMVTSFIQEKLVQKYRENPSLSENTFSSLLKQENLSLNLTKLLFAGHWITPEISPKRFDTKFFIMEAPAEQSLFHDGNEAVTADWLTPSQILEKEKRGKIGLMFPTKLNILKLARFNSVTETLAPHNWQPVVEVMPYMIKRDGERWLTIPANAGYDFFEVPESQIFEFAGLKKAGKQKKQ